MSDKRRRRRRTSDGGSEGSEDEEGSLTGSDHEYESAAEDSGAEVEVEPEEEDESEPHIEAEAADKPASAEKPPPNIDPADDKHDEELNNEADDEEEEEERGAGDGQEEASKGARLDYDEDKRYPQYIPKVGMFYEHDDRNREEDDAEAAVIESEAKPRRVPKSEATNRWGHDKFLERDQAPKSKEELVSTYGYDIRNEDNAPRARRRRRYGRGPTKYTRSWEDEEAYSGGTAAKEQQVPRGGKTRGRGRGGATSGSPQIEDAEDFPELEPKRQVDKTRTEEPSGNRGGRGRGQRGRPEPSNTGRGGGKKDYSANNRLSKPPRPVSSSNKQLVDQAVEAKLDMLERDMANKAKVSSDNNSPRQQRRSNENVHNGQQQINTTPLPVGDVAKPKRYLRQPRVGQQPQQQQQIQQQQYYNEYPEQHQQQQKMRPNLYENVTSAGNYTASPAFPTSASGPPPSAPFLTTTTAHPGTPGGRVQLSHGNPGGPYIDPAAAAAIVNYGPPQVQYAPVAVPVTVTGVPLVGVPPGATPHDTLAVLAPPPPHMNAAAGATVVTTPDQVLLAAAAAAGQGYAEVRGGVTYFNPTAQAPVVARHVNKRPKAAIPIVDPSQVESPQSNRRGMHHSSEMTPQTSTEEPPAENIEHSDHMEPQKKQMAAAAT